MRKPRIFIASSVESLKIAEAVNVNLDHEFEVTIWKSGTFKLSSTTLEDLVSKASTVDFALFIFAPDDIATIKDRKEHVVRDNVLFEMGLFIGSIGKERCYILKPRDVDMHLPTDLLGMTPADFDPSRSDNDLVSATNRACSLIKAEVEKLGKIQHVKPSSNKRIQSNPPLYQLAALDYKVLAACLGSQTSSPNSQSFSNISSSFRKVDDALLQISLIKLERMGYISKSIETDDQYGYDYYCFAISELGIDELLRNEDKLVVPKASESQDSFDDDIPF
jgi:hypothetical protein